MSDLCFEWDSRKSAASARKHGITFEEASSVFLDENALLLADPDHSKDEDRFLLLGFSQDWNLLVVCHCYRESEEVVRLISARRAHRQERKQYNTRWKR